MKSRKVEVVIVRIPAQQRVFAVPSQLHITGRLLSGAYNRVAGQAGGVLG